MSSGADIAVTSDAIGTVDGASAVINAYTAAWWSCSALPRPHGAVRNAWIDTRRPRNWPGRPVRPVSYSRVRGVIVVLLCRLVPADIARRIYSLRYAAHDAVYWRFMGKHYGLSARHMLIVRRPISLGGARGKHHMVDEWVKWSAITTPNPGMYARCTMRGDRHTWLANVTGIMYTYYIASSRIAFASRARCVELTGYSGCPTGYSSAPTYVNGAIPFAEFIIWLVVGLNAVDIEAPVDVQWRAIRDAASEHVYNTATDARAELESVWEVLLPGHPLTFVEDTWDERADIIAGIMSRSDYSGWIPPLG